ncbi:pyruvate oxidase [Mucilaginibacter sp. HMF7410]|uniref:Pyruvate oxidase n=2 Tax=Mucilaginibacter arboris TaxID=2682090 RepID=A0A7K1SX30_9SPHI|nr:pyruvate oxidase [Mucilaginibacter arboris]
MKNTSRRKFVQNISLAIAGAATVPEFLAAKLVQPLNTGHIADQENLIEPSSSDNTSDILIDKLIAWKVEVIFGMIGDGINPIIESIRKKQDKIRFITVRHEEAAAFMASGYFKHSGKLAACIATSGPGAVHLMNGIYDAAKENVPVIAITGSTYHDLLGTHFTQEVDTVSLMKDATVFNQMLTGPQHALTAVDLACRAALTTPGVAHLTISTDVQQKVLSEDKKSKKAANLHGSSTYMPRVETPEEDELNTAANLINSSSKVMILAGRGALKARAEVGQLAEKLGAPVAKALLGKALLPDDSPFTTGGTGHLGTYPSQQMMAECDLLLILGSTMPWIEYYPKNAKGIQIDRDPKRIGLRFPVDIGLNGDVKATLTALLPKLKKNSNHSFLQLAQQRMADWKKTIARLEEDKSLPIKPPFLVAQVNRLLTDDAMISIDTGAHTVFTARHIQIRPQQQVAVCGNLASMAPGLPYAIAAQIAYPGRQSIAMVGDGGFTMLMGEMATAVRYNLPVKVVVFKNNTLSMDQYEQLDIGSKPYGIDLQPIDFVKIAEACGAEGYRCTKPDEIASTLKKAFASTRPAVIEVLVDPEQNPAPPDKLV